MKDSESILELFQDPLLTIIALVLLSTVWIIIPRGVETPSGDISVARKEIERLKQDLSSIRMEFKKVKSELFDFEKEFKVLERKRETSESAVSSEDLVMLKKKITKKREQIQSKNEELMLFESRLFDVQTVPDAGANLEEIVAELQLVKSESYFKKKTEEKLVRELSILQEEAELQSLKEERQKRKKDKKQKNDLNDVELIEMEIETLRAELKRVLENVQGGGYEEYTYEKTSGKKQVLFEAVEDRIIFVDDESKNYTRQEGLWSVSEGVEHTAYKLLKKYDVKGESIDEIHSPSSEFQMEINRHDPRKEYVIFFVRNDSFDAFRKARTLIEDRFVVGWVPQEGPIYLVGGGGNAIPGR